MGKSDENQTKKRAHKAKATDGESKHKNKPSFDSHGSSPFETTFEAIDNDGGLRHSRWRDHFRQLCEYKVQFGHCLVPQRYAANPKLGTWVNNQRKTYKLYQEGKPSSMTAEHIRALDGIGFDWGTSTSTWSERFAQLLEFKVQFGHCLVPQRYAVNPALGNWVQKQRTRYRKNTEENATSMTAEHIRALDGIGFDWGTRKTERTSLIWSERFEQLLEFKLQFGHCLVPQKYATNPTLGTWVSTQRKTYKLYQEGKPSPMTAEHIRALDGIGFDWGRSKTEVASTWSERFRELCEFKVQFGHCLVPQQYAANPTLGKWVKKQRCSYKLYQEGKPSPMTAEHIC
jgi:hypothetical protein